MAESTNPLSVGETLFRACEIGLDDEILDYIKESHGIQIKVGAEPFYLWYRVDQGTLISKSITTFETTGTQYSAYIWQPGDGETNHPNARIQENSFKVFQGATEMVRAYDVESIAFDTEYALIVEPGTDSSTSGAVRIWFNLNYAPTNVAYAYRNICSCVDITTGYPNRECPICRGTSYPAAFTQYTTAATKYYPANTVLIRVPMAAETLTPEQIGRVLRRDLRHWMTESPIVNNFDLIMGTTGRNVGVLFEIVTKSDSRWRGEIIHQEFQTVRIEETDIRYKLAPVSVSAITQLTTLITSDAEIT